MTKALTKKNTEIVEIETEDSNTQIEINKLRQEKFKNFYLEGNAVKRSMLLAGYSKNYVKVHWRDYAEKNVNLSELGNALRREAGINGIYSLRMARSWMQRGSERKAMAGMDHISKMNRIHMEDKTPSTLVFQLQTIQGETVNLGAKQVEKGDVTDISQSSQNQDEEE